MSGWANQGSYSNTGSPWGQGAQPGWNQHWDAWRCWYAAKPLWIAAMILGFIFWWPVGLALLFLGIWGKRMAFGGCGGWQRAGNNGGWYTQGGPPPWAGWRGFWSCGPANRQQHSSGNHAFDEYRADTLRRLEEEQKEFAAFLERLRFAKDKAEFDQFMNDRRNRPPAPPEAEGPQSGVPQGS